MGSTRDFFNSYVRLPKGTDSDVWCSFLENHGMTIRHWFHSSTLAHRGTMTGRAGRLNMSLFIPDNVWVLGWMGFEWDLTISFVSVHYHKDGDVLDRCWTCLGITEPDSGGAFATFVPFEKDAWHICSSYILSCLHRTVVSHEVVVSSDFPKRGMGSFCESSFSIKLDVVSWSVGFPNFPDCPISLSSSCGFTLPHLISPISDVFFLMYPLSIERSYGKSPCSVGNWS